MTKLHLVMSYHSWSEMHLNHTSFIVWLLSSLNDFFFQRLVQAIFNIGIIWACPNSTIDKVKTTKKCNIQFNPLSHVIDKK